MFNGVLDWLEDVLNTILIAVMNLLPDSPFKITLPPEVENILGYINWLIPFDLMTNTLLVWSGAIVIYYAYMTVLRWAKAIK